MERSVLRDGTHIFILIINYLFKSIVVGLVLHLDKHSLITLTHMHSKVL